MFYYMLGPYQIKVYILELNCAKKQFYHLSYTSRVIIFLAQPQHICQPVVHQEIFKYASKNCMCNMV